MVETLSRCVSFVDAADGDLDEISNEDITCEVIAQSTTYVGTGTQGSINVHGDVCFPS